MRKSIELQRDYEAMKNKIATLKAENKLDDAHALLPELKELENKVKSAILDEELEDKNFKGEDVMTGTNKGVDKNKVFNKLVLGRALNEEEREFVNKGQIEHVGEDGGYLVPEEQFQQIKEFRRALNPLKELCNIIPVKTLSGKMPLGVDEDDELTNFNELDHIPESKVKFAQTDFKVDDYGDIIPISNTLLDDETANIVSYIIKRFGKKSVRTENSKIIKEVEKLSKTAITDYKGILTALNKTLDPAISATSIILTNQSGFDYLDLLEDGNGRPLLTIDLTDPTKKLLKGRKIVVTTDKVLKNKKLPFVVGDMEEYITFFDRVGLELAVSKEAGFTKNATLLRAIERFDVKVIDKDAMVYLELAPATGA